MLKVFCPRRFVGQIVVGRRLQVARLERCEPFARVRMALTGGAAEPIDRLLGALRHAIAVFVHCAQIELRPRQTLVSGLTIPGDGFRIALTDAGAQAISYAQFVLRLGVASFGGAAEPAFGFVWIDRQIAQTVTVKMPKLC